MGSLAETRTGGRPATTGVIPGDIALSVGRPEETAPRGWKWTALSDVARLETGHTPSRKHPEYWGGDVPWIGIKDATANHGRTIHDTYQHTNKLGIENSSARILPANTVCLSRTASVGYVVVMGRPMATSQDFVNWVCSDKLDHLYLKYVLLTEKKAFLRFASGTTHQTIYFPEVKAFHICLPPLAEQRAIAHIVGTLDDKIELNSKMNQTIEAMARSIFKSWFVDFGPVRAKADGQNTGLPADIAALFPDSFEDSELGEIPKGWKIQSIVDLAELNSWTLSKSDVLDQIEYIEISEVSKGNIGTIQVYKRGEEPSRARRRLRHGDTVLSTVRPDRGSYFLCLNPTQNQIASTGFAVFTPKKTPWSLLHAALTQDELFERMGHLADGGAYPAIRPEIIGERRLPMPVNTAITDAFHQICGSLYEKAEQNRRESRHLAGLRDALLPKLLSGEIRTHEAN